MPSGKIFQLDAKGVKRLFAKVLSRTRPDVVSKVIGEDLLRWVINNFRDQGTESSWEPMAPSTRAARRTGEGEGGAQLLQDTGRLRKSYIKGRKGNIFKPRDYAVTVGSQDERAIWHEEGTDPYPIPKSGTALMGFMNREGELIFRHKVDHPGLPARPMLPSDRAAREVMIKAMEGILKKAVEG